MLTALLVNTVSALAVHERRENLITQVGRYCSPVFYNSPKTAWFQSSTATVTGTVVDDRNAVIPGATITIENPGTQLERRAKTNSEGQFVIPLLPPNTYSLTVQHDGFAPFRISQLILNVNDQRAILIQMKINGLQENEVDVTGADESVNNSPAAETVVDHQFVENASLNGRSYQSLWTLAPGVILTRATSTDQGQFSVNGQRADSNYTSIDGVSANIGVSGNSAPGQSTSGALPGLAVTGGSNNLISIDALQEFKIQTSTYAPEFGRTPGAQVSLVTRSGTAEFHGTAFEYFRNDALDANDFFANSRGLAKPALRQNIFGGVLGGPVYLPRFGEGGPALYSGKKHTFFFFSYEGQRIRQPLVGITEVPTLSTRQNAPAALRPFLNAFPLPNGPLHTNSLAEFAASFSNPSTLNATSIRIDHTFGKKGMLFGRYNVSPSNSTQRAGGGPSSLNDLSKLRFKTQTLTFGTTLIATDRIVNDFRINYSSNTGDSVFSLDGFGGAVVPPDSLVFPPIASPQTSLFTFFVRSGTGSLYQVGRLAGNKQHQFNAVDGLSIVIGSHQLKTGVDFRRLTPVISGSAYAQSPIFLSVSELNAGVPSQTVVGATAAPREPLFTNISLYGQDTWQVTRRLSLTYGLRYEVNPPPTERNGNDPAVVSGLNNPDTATLAAFGTPLYRTTYNNLAPRAGLAFQLSQKRGKETVLRGGLGVFYDMGTTTSSAAFGSSAFPYTAQVIRAGAQFPLTTILATPPAISRNLPVPSGTLVEAFDPDLKLPLTYQWNVAMDQSLGSNQKVTIAYVGAAGRRLLRREGFLNPNPNFPVLEVTTNAASSDYHALQAQFQRRLSNGLQVQLSYTWAKSLDNLSSDALRTVPTVRLDPKVDRAPSDFDVRHAFSSAITYDVPALSFGKLVKFIFRDFSLDALATARSATPVDVTIQRNIGFGTFAFRPDLVEGVPLYIYNSAFPGGQRINNTFVATSPRQIGPFLIPTTARQGSLGRNSLRGLPVYQADLGIRRKIFVTEHLNFQLKAEVFNVFNHPNFADPSGLLGSDLGATVSRLPGFGQVIQMFGRGLGSGGVSGGFNPLYQMGGPRSIQLSLKLQF